MTVLVHVYYRGHSLCFGHQKEWMGQNITTTFWYKYELICSHRYLGCLRPCKLAVACCFLAGSPFIQLHDDVFKYNLLCWCQAVITQSHISLFTEQVQAVKSTVWYVYSTSKCWPGWRGVELDSSGSSRTHTLELESVRVSGQALCGVPGAVCG